ncbi:MAG: cell division protein FtsA, partial [Ferruginibacter sp.]|nr:cell division protein FtsA [Ferruginibacter sp.]
AMKVQFGSALSDEEKSNVYITIPGLRGMSRRQISVKNLANIIQARMSEILDFVSYHLKQVGLDTRMLNGGIILTGGGSQLKHLLQLTEYSTGLNARIGYPNEHLTGDYREELSLPMYSTCIGLILKGYNEYENKIKNSDVELIKIKDRTEVLTTETPTEVDIQQETDPEIEDPKPRGIGSRIKTLKEFMDFYKGKLIDLFTEEEKDVKL